MLKRDFGFSDQDITEIMEKILSFVTLVNPAIKVDIVKNDSDDNAIIECAITSKSAYIITYDKHLLNLKEYNKIRIIKPEEAGIIF